MEHNNEGNHPSDTNATHLARADTLQAAMAQSNAEHYGAAAALDAVLARLSASRAEIASRLEERGEAPADLEPRQTAKEKGNRKRKRIQGDINPNRVERLAEAWKTLDVANEALSGAHVAVSQAKQLLEEKEERILELGERVEASGEFAAELVRMRQQVETSKAKALEDETAKQGLENKLRQERDRANRLRQREIALVKEIAELRSRLKEEQVVILINELRRRLHAINRGLADEGHRVRLFVQVDKLSTEIGDDADQVLGSTQASRQIARMLIRIKDGQQIRYPIYKDTLTVGRTADNDIQIPDREVSGYHALLCGDGDETYIEDLQSKNGVYVNDVRVTNERLKDGDEITIGGADFLYRTKDVNGSGVKALT